MPKVVVKDGESLETALKRFSKVTAEVRKESRKREFYLRPGLKRKEKSKEAQKRAKKTSRARKSY